MAFTVYKILVVITPGAVCLDAIFGGFLVEFDGAAVREGGGLDRPNNKVIIYKSLYKIRLKFMS